MTRLKPVSRRVLIEKMRKLGFAGPFSGGSHSFVSRGERDVVIPNPHQKDIGVDLLARILRQADISRREWLKEE